MRYGRGIILTLSVVLLFSSSANAELTRKWSYLSDSSVYFVLENESYPEHSDYNEDNIIDPVFKDGDSLVLLDGSSGSIIYKTALPQNFSVWCIAQIDPNAAPEIVLTSYDPDSILVLDAATGDRKWVYKRALDYPLVLDLDGDDYCEIVFSVSDTVLCYGWPSKVGDEIDQPTLPKDLQLDQNYPNPFNPATTIEFSLRHGAVVSLEIVNLLGRRVRTLMDQSLPAGSYSIKWDGTEDDGSPVATGMYFYILKAGDQREEKKMILLK